MANEAVTREFKVTLQIPVSDPADMSGDHRRAALASVRCAEARLAGWKTRLINAERYQCGEGATESVLRDALLVSKRDAKREVDTAANLSGLTATWKALESGEIPQRHAWLIAKASSEGLIDESALAEAAKHQPYDQFARTVRQQQRELSDDDGQSILDGQCERRKAQVFESLEDGMFVLSGEYDPITGNRIALAISDKERELWLGRNRRIATEAQRAALALRDKGCIGCDANPAWCQAHHIQPWSWGGPTNLDNLVLVCARCHHNIHDDGWEVARCPSTGHYDLRPPPDPFPETGVDTYQPPQHNPVLLS